MTRKNKYILLLLLTIFFTLCAVWTVLPTGSNYCLLGYKAHCTFTPVSTVICLLLSGITCKIRAAYFKN
ncbi:MAG TPA: hypothetical protein VKS21_10510 [Spirochaetota bacterium]|nr:hypothetical protein [Spirochaetota bacterium]